MGDITKNFSRSEFACRCGCGNDLISEELVECLQWLRDTLARPLSPNSGARCWLHNKSINGSPHSQHLCGKAADIRCPTGMTPTELAAIAETIPEFKNGGIGIYKTFVHLDVRGYKARWTG